MNSAALTTAPTAQQTATSSREVIDDALGRLAGATVHNGRAAVHEDPEVLRGANAVLMATTCLALAVAGHPATVSSPAGDRTKAEIIAYWSHRFDEVTRSLDDAISAHVLPSAHGVPASRAA